MYNLVLQSAIEIKSIIIISFIFIKEQLVFFFLVWSAALVDFHCKKGKNRVILS